jgi:hypothetical protein
MPEMYDRIRTLVEAESEFEDLKIPPGSVGTIVYVYKEPEGYAIDLEIPREDLTGGKRWENVVLTPDQFVVIPKQQTEGAAASDETSAASSTDGEARGS